MKSEKKKKKQGRPSGSGPSPMIIGIAVVVAATLAWFMINKSKGPSDPQGDAALEKLEGGTEFEDLGRTVAIGPAVKDITAKGTEIVGVEDVKGLEAALDGVDVDAVIDLIKKAKIAHVLVDPSITVRNPMPLNNVRNRLALAHAAGRLNATLMSKRFFLYEIDEPAPSLTMKEKAAVIQMVRHDLGVEGVEAPKSTDILTAKNGWKTILTVRKVQGRHLVFFTLDEDTLEESAKKGASKLSDYWDSKGFDEEFGPLEKALESKVTLEFEVVYDEGTFVGVRDNIFLWRIIEPGIYGVRMKTGGRLRQLPPWYTVTNNLRTIKSILERMCKRMGREDSECWTDADRSIGRFRTVHWRERSPGGKIEDLYRASPNVPSTGMVTKENILKSLVGLNDWLADNQVYPSGRCIYRYFPTKDKENDEYNSVRHTLGPFSMALTQEFAPDPRYKEVADSGMRYIEDRIRWGGAPRKGAGEIDNSIDTWMGKPLPGPDVAIYEVDENEFDDLKGEDWASKMGGVSVAILGYSQYKRVGWELSEKGEKVLKGLANLLLYMQKDDGSFHHYYVARQNKYYATRNSIYPGEILYAMARLFGETRDERFRTAFKASMKKNLDWFKQEMEQKEPDGTYVEDRRTNLVQFQPWIAMAMEEMHRYDPDPSYVEASNLVSMWVLDTYQFNETNSFYPDYLGGYMKVLDELPAMHAFVYTEGTAASYVLAHRGGAPKEVVEKLRKGALLSARFIIQMQTRPGENDYYYPNPKKAKGAVRYCMNHNKQRIDYTYHALSSMYRILHAATPEDYAFIQSIDMPKTW